MAVLKNVLRSTFYVLCSTFWVLTAYAQSFEPQPLLNSGGLQSHTPYQFFSDEEAINISDGNLFFENEDVKLPGRMGMDAKFSRSFNSLKSEMTIEEFVRVFKDVRGHITVDRRGLQYPDIDRIVYYNETISLGSLGFVSAVSTDSDGPNPHNKIALKTGTEGWQISWADYRGVILLINVSPNTSHNVAYVLLIRKDGAAEPFNIQTGESLWQKSGKKFVTSLLGTLEEIEKLHDLVLHDKDNRNYLFRRSVSGDLNYGVDFSWEGGCKKWKIWPVRCRGHNDLTGWKVYGYHLSKIEEESGHFLEANVLEPSVSQSQTIIDQNGRRIIRIVNEDSSETWEAPWFGGETRRWRLEFDDHRRITRIVDPEGNVTRYQYDFASATSCPGCLPPRRSKGWDSLTTPSLFVQIEYPTGGVLRYEWFGDPNETELFRRYIIVTEFPDSSNPSVFYQKYFSVAENRSPDQPTTVQTQVYEADGAESSYSFEKVRERYLLKRHQTTTNRQTLTRFYEWKLNADELSADGIQRMEMQQGSDPRFTAYSADYDDKGRLTLRTDANGDATSYRYQGDTNLVTQGSRSTTTTFYEYGGEDICGRPLQDTWLRRVYRNIQGNAKTLRAFCYDDFGNIVKTFEKEPSMEERRFSVSYSESAVPAGTAQNVYDLSTGLLLSQTDPYGVKALFSHNKIGGLMGIRFPNNAFIQHTYEIKNGDPQKSNKITTVIQDATTGRNIIVERRYNGLDQLIQEIRGDQTVQYTYNPSKQLASQTYSDGRQVSFEYDGFGRISAKYVSGLSPLKFEYSIQVENNIPLQITTVKIGDRPVERLSYDFEGNLRRLEKIDGATVLATTRYEYDAEGNLSNITSPKSLSIQNTINYAEGITTRTFPGGDRLTIEDPSGVGLASQVTAGDPNSEVQASLVYAAGGLLKEIRYPEDQNDLTLNWGEVGTKAFNRLIKIDDALGEVSFAYNAGGVAEVIERKLDGLGSYKFYQVKDGFGNLARLIYPNGLVVFYKRDEKNRITEVRKDSEEGLLLASIRYKPNDQPAEIRYANGIIATYEYDLVGRVQSITIRRGEKYTLQDSYAYDERGRKTFVKHLDGSKVEYEYDQLNRITKAKYYRKGESQASDDQSYTYDLEGNRISYQDPKKQITYEVDDGNRITQYKIGGKDKENLIGQLEYQRGNLSLQKEVQNGQETFRRELSFDEKNHLVSAKTEDFKNKFKTESNYTYDYTGRRESVEVDGRKSYYLFGEALDPLMELDESGEIKTFYIYIGTRRLAAISGDELKFYHADELDNVLKVSDEDGEVVQTARYDPFGNVNFLNGSDHNNYLFAGKPYDQATGLYYFGARYYDPILGRFLSRDPLLQGTNHYIYANNNPLTQKDIFGLWGFFIGFSGGFGGGGFSIANFNFAFQVGPITLGFSPSLKEGQPSFASLGIGSLVFSASLPSKIGENAIFGISSLIEGTRDLSQIFNVFGPQASVGVRFAGEETSLHASDPRFGQNFLDPSATIADASLRQFFEPQQLQELVNYNVGWNLAPDAQNSMDLYGTMMAIAKALDLPTDTLVFDGNGSTDPYREGAEGGTGGTTGGSTGQESSNFTPKESTTNPQQVGNHSEEDPKQKHTKGSEKNVPQYSDIDPVLLHSGDLLQTNTDLKIPGRGLDFEFTRTYRSRITFDGPLGFNWDHNYNKRLNQRPDGNIARFDGQARFDIYVKNADGTYTSPSGYFDTLTVAKDESGKMIGAIIKDKHGTENVYGADGFITQIKDRNGNVMRFEYENERLIRVIDTAGRAIEYTYNSSGKLSEIKDFSGRTVQFGYDNHGDPVSVTNPAGQTTRYTYSSGYMDDREELNHNILTVTDAKGQTYLKNTYSIYDRVIKQTFGDEGTFLIEYNQVASSLECTPDLIDKVFYRTNVTDRIGNKIDYVFNCQGNPLQIIRYTRGVRAGDPAKFITQYKYNKDGLLTKEMNPKGDTKEYEFDAKGNLITLKRLPATGSSETPLITALTYDPQFSQLISVADPAGHETTFTLDEKGNITQKCLPTIVHSTSHIEQICETYIYNEHGQITQIVDGENNTDTYTYNDANGYLERITRDAGQGKLNLTNIFGYDSVGNITSFTDGRGNAFGFEVNKLNQVTKEKAPAPLNYERLIEYDENNNVVKVAGNAAVTTTFTYNILDRVTTKRETIDGARIALTEYQYDLNENLIRIVEPEGNSTFILYDERDLPYQITKGYRTSEASTKTFTYDLNGNVNSMRDGNGHVYGYQYDGFNRLEKIIDPLQGEMEADYDLVSNITSITRRGPPDGDNAGTLLSQTRFDYDALNRLIQRIEENGNQDVTTRYAYDRSNRLTQLTDANNQIARFVYDGADWLIQKTDPLGNQTRYAYDGNGNLTSEQSIEGAETFTNIFVYDALNRLIQRADNAGHTFSYEYDSRNNLVATTDPKDTAGLDTGATQGSGNRVRYTYDGINRLIAETKELRSTGAGDGAITETITTHYGYNDNGRLTEITDANNHITRFAYDGLNRQIEVKLHNNQTYAKRYDRNSNLLEEIQPNGHKVASIYDALNRLLSKEITLRNSPAGTESFKYDSLSRMVEAKNVDPFGNVLGTVGLTYDMLSRVTAETQNGRTISKVYDGVGNVTKRTYPSGRVVDNVYDGLNRLTGIQQTPTASGILETIFGADTVNILNAAYIGKDRPETFTFGNGTAIEFAYDNLKRLTALTVRPEPVEGQIIAGFAYGYDKAGNRLFEQHLHNDGIANVFSYDSLYRLISSKTQVPSPAEEIRSPGSMPYGISNQWTLDKVDNWLSKVGVIASPQGEAIQRTSTFTPNEVNAYTSVDGQPYIYDENGNLIDDGVHTYQYNYRNLLTRVVNKADGTEVASYGYDALGRRIFKTVAGQMNRFVYEGVHVIVEIAPDDSISKEFIYGNSIDDPIALIAHSTSHIEQTCYYHTDGLGSTVSLTDADGQVVETYKYGAYGEVEIHDVDGALLEDSAAGNPFLYTGQMYDAETGFYYYKARYYHPTLGRFLQRDPLGYVDGYNLYAYVANNPINWIDPLGFYQGDVHRGLSEYLALKAGLGQERARFIGEYAQRPDDRFATTPVWTGAIDFLADPLGIQSWTYGKQTLEKWHFPMDPGSNEVVPGSNAARAMMDLGIKNRNIIQFASGLHPYEDSSSHRGKPYFERGFGHGKDSGGMWSFMKSDADLTFLPSNIQPTHEMSWNVYKAMLDFRKSNQEINLDQYRSLLNNYSTFKPEIDAFIRASTREEKLRILRQWGVTPNERGTWDMDFGGHEHPKKKNLN